MNVGLVTPDNHLREGDCEPWDNQSVAMGGCDKNDVSGLTKGEMFGCGGLSGGLDSSHCIDLDSVNFKGYGNKAVTLTTKYIIKKRHQTSPKCVIPTLQVTRQNAGDQRRRHMEEVIKKYCRLNPEVAVIINGPRARRQSIQLTPFHVRTGIPVYQTSCEDDCVQMSVINAVRIMRGIESSDHVCKILRTDSTVFHNFKPLGLLFHTFGQGLGVRKVCKDGRRFVHSKDRMAGFK